MDKNKSLKRKKSRASTSSVECASYRATLKRTFRFLTVLLVMLIAGSTGAWGQENGDGSLIPNGDEEDNLNIKLVIKNGDTYTLSNEDECGEVSGKGYGLPGDCDWTRFIIHVKPKAGFATGLCYIYSFTGDFDDNEKIVDPQYYSVYESKTGILAGDFGTVNYPVVDPYSEENNENSYSNKERDITIYEQGHATQSKIVVVFVPFNCLALTHTLGSNATVTFFDGGTTYPNTAKFDPANYPETIAITSIDNSDDNDRYIIAHIVPNDGYWTERQYLSAKELQATSTAITPAGARSASVRAKAPSEEDSKLNLLVRDVYTPDPNQPTITQPRYDGAAWYWYLLPKEHTVRSGYINSTIEGDIVPKFDLNSENVSQSGNVVTVTDGTENGWYAEITLDKVSFPFNGSDQGPKITSISIGKEGKTGMVLYDPDIIGRHLCINGSTKVISRNPMAISTIPSDAVTTTKNGYYKNSCWDESKAGFDITVPFTTDANSTAAKGSSSNPWLIRSAEDLNMLAKCVNIGQYSFKGEYLKQTANITYNNTTSADFKPIGGSTPFQGNYDGNLQTISGLTITYATDSESDNEPYVGLFGKIKGSATVDNVTLENCSFSATASSNAVAVGGIAGLIEATDDPEAVKVSNCKVLVNGESAKSAISGLSTGCATGAIVGISNGTLTNNYYGYDVTVTNSSGSASGYTKRGYWNSTSTKWDDITTKDGAMLYVKKAKIDGGTTKNGSSVVFNETTTPDIATTENPANCYSIDDTKTPKEYSYAVGQPITLSVTQGTIQQGARTLTEELTALTVNDGQSYKDKDILTDKKFNMLEHDATVTPTFKASEWFTVSSNQKKWMTFYHELKDGNNAAANYSVTDGTETTSSKTIKVWTITAIDAATGGITKKDLGGVSFSGVPTLFNNDSNLPAVLKFTPATGVTAPTDVATQFKGVAAATALSGDNIYVMNGDGEFDHAYLPASGSNTLNANRCYINLGTNSGARRLFFIEEAVTGIGEVTGVAEVTDHGASLNDKGEMINDKWFTLDGRKLDKMPTKKGLYIYKGKLTVIK